MKRIQLVPTTINEDGARVAIVDGAGYSNIHSIGNRMLVLADVLDGTPQTANTIADITLDADGRMVDVDPAPLSNAQRTTLRAWLTSQGIDPAGLTAVDVPNRKEFLRWLLRKLGRTIDVQQLLSGYGVG